MFALDISDEKKIRILEITKKRKRIFVQGMGEEQVSDIHEIPPVLQKLVNETTPNPSRVASLPSPFRKKKRLLKL